MTQVLSLGLDGAAWHKIDRMIANGKLPNMERLVNEGTRAPLRSVNPPVTCPAWRCSTSGKDPGKTGVYWWLNLDRETGEFRSPDAKSFETADIWDYLSEDGKRCAVLNVPLTYPPTPVNGLMVSGFGAPFEMSTESEPLTHPPAFEDRLREEYDWRIGVDDITGPDGPERAYELIRSRFELLKDVLEEDEYDYVHLTLFYINMLQHKYGDGPETEFGWQLIDEYLGEVYDPDRLTVIYSDHGHTNIEHTFMINTWLEEEGYLETESETSDALYGNLYELLISTGVSPRRIAETARTILPEELYDRIVPTNFSSAELMDRIDWDRSTAVATSQGPLYINRDRVDDYEAVRTTLREELESLRFGTEPVLEDVHPAEDVYSPEYRDRAPDLLLVASDGWEIYGGLTPSVFESQNTSWTSGNHPEGIVLFAGDGVGDRTLDERSILDVMPTVLRYLGSPIPTDVEGTSIEEAFEEGLEPIERREPITRTRSADAERPDGDELEEHLEELGYLE